MEHDTDKLELLIKKLMEEDALEQPSSNFTDKVMDKVYSLESSSVTTYTPLISIKTWVIVILCFASLCLYIYFSNSPSSGEWLSRLDLSILNLNLFSELDLKFSKTLEYASVLLALMVGIQIVVLKTYFNQRMSF